MFIGVDATLGPGEDQFAAEESARAGTGACLEAVAGGACATATDAADTAHCDSRSEGSAGSVHATATNFNQYRQRYDRSSSQSVSEFEAWR